MGNCAAASIKKRIQCVSNEASLRSFLMENGPPFCKNLVIYHALIYV